MKSFVQALLTSLGDMLKLLALWSLSVFFEMLRATGSTSELNCLAYSTPGLIL